MTSTKKLETNSLKVNLLAFELRFHHIIQDKYIKLKKCNSV